MTLWPQTIDKMREEMLGLLSEFGGHMGNISLKEELKKRDSRWSDDLYWQIRNDWIDAGKLTTGRGKGGSVDIVKEEPAPESFSEGDGSENDVNVCQTESDLYPSVLSVLNNSWIKEQRYDNHIAEVTANQGRRNTGGTWTRPDIVVVGVRCFHYLPGKYIDIVTFEVKKEGCWDVAAVYEALGHRRQATQSYVLLHSPTETNQELLSAIENEAERHGIGVIVAEKIDDFGTWDTIVKAVRMAPDPYMLDDFISRQLSPASRNNLAKYVK